MTTPSDKTTDARRHAMDPSGTAPSAPAWPPIADLVPHGGTMCLLDEVLEIGDEHLRARITPRADDPFADTSATAGPGIPGWVGLEWLAQAIAAWSGHTARAQGGTPQIGFLLGARRYHCEVEQFALGAPIEVAIHLDYRADNGLGAFRGELCGADGVVLAHAVLNVFQPDSADALAAMLEDPAS
ncbi:ApeP family dehydratase [Halomonas sp. V046]|uniref:ApeP family dehydratase n=1 Tax=Halomonas sp. V046 TaxID=3459611 RepID=UPI004043B405